jgi:hypothetical protein
MEGLASFLSVSSAGGEPSSSFRQPAAGRAGGWIGGRGDGVSVSDFGCAPQISVLESVEQHAMG